MDKFIEVKLIHQNGQHLDTTIWIRIDQIVCIANPTKTDLNHRKEICAIIHLQGGNCYAVGNFPNDIIEKLADVEF